MKTINRKDPVATEMGRRLHDERNAKGMTQKELSAATGWPKDRKRGMSPGAIGNYEQGSRQITLARAQTLAKILGMPACYFLAEISREEALVILAMRSERK